MERSYRYDDGVRDEGVTTLVELIEDRAVSRGDDEYMRFHRGESLTFGGLRERARHYAGYLQARGIKRGNRVLLLLPTSPQFLFALFGTMFAGAIPVPLYPPPGLKGIDAYVGRQTRIARNCGASALITNQKLGRIGGFLEAQGSTLRAVHTVEAIDAADPQPVHVPRATSRDLALIQYTSGSTGGQKGVTLCHGNILSNTAALGFQLRFRDDDRMINWLPLYHDMGLIGMVMLPLCFGVRTYMMTPFDFLRDPRAWFQAISDERCTIGVAPNFAYSYSMKRMEGDDLAGLDLSCWRVCFNGAEPISREVVEAFTERFAPAGFRETTFSPVYGMAENGLIVTCPDHTVGPAIDVVDRAALEREGVATPSDGTGSDVKAVVGVGRPVMGTQLRIVGDDGTELAERQQGEVEIRGLSLMRGYYNNDAATRDALHDGWLRTGDLGYLVDGQLHVTGRRKDLIIRNGTNYYPQDIEEAADGVPGVRRGCSVAFGVFDEEAGSERIVVAVECKERPEIDAKALVDGVRKAVAARVGCLPDAVEVVPPRTIPKTSSGKLRRATSRERYLAGTLTPTAGATFDVLRVYVKTAVAKIGKTFAGGSGS